MRPLTLDVRPLALALAAGLLLGGCALVEPEPEQVQVGVSDIYGPDQAAPGETLAFTLHGFALGASLRVEARSDRRADVTVWAPEPDGDMAWCGTPPLPLLGRFDAVMPAEGDYVLRAVQPDGGVVEKRVSPSE